MTLSTNVAVSLHPDSTVSSREVLDALLDALIEAGGSWTPDLSENIFSMNPTYGESTRERPKVTEEKSSHSEDGDIVRIGSEMGQGFHAITDITYRVGGQLYAKDTANWELYPEDYDPIELADLDGYAHKLAYPACTYLLDMDTAYGSTFNDDAAPGVTNAWSLHLVAILKLRLWLTKNGGGKVKFQGESTSEWFDGDDEKGFESILSSGGSASSWFHNVVQPVVDAEIAASGGQMVWHG